MKLTRERKVYLAILAAGLVALIVDRLSGGPGRADAGGASQYSLAGLGTASADATASSPGASAGVGGSLQATSTVSARLRRLTRMGASTVPSRDLFRAPVSWSPPQVVVSPTTLPAGKELTPTDFERTHRMTAVLIKGRETHAVVDGKMIAPGQWIDGFMLITVTQDAAVFRSNAGTAILRSEQKGPINGNLPNP